MNLSPSIVRGLVRIGNTIILLRLTVRNTGVINLARVDGVGAQVVLDVTRSHEGGVQVVKRGVAVDLEGPVATDIVDGGGSGAEVTVKVLEVLCLSKSRISTGSSVIIFPTRQIFRHDHDSILVAALPRSGHGNLLAALVVRAQARGIMTVVYFILDSENGCLQKEC